MTTFNIFNMLHNAPTGVKKYAEVPKFLNNARLPDSRKRKVLVSVMGTKKRMPISFQDQINLNPHKKSEGKNMRSSFASHGRERVIWFFFLPGFPSADTLLIADRAGNGW